MFQVGEWTWELILCLPDVLVYTGEVDEAILQGVKRPWGFFFCVLGIQKREIDEVGEVMFQEGEWQ
jgi:hypothetical protein